MAAAAGARHGSARDSRTEVVILDLAGRRVELPREEAERLRLQAKREAGHSSVARDLSVILGRIAATRPILSLRRVEARTLAQIGSELGMHDLVDDIEEAL